MNDIHTTVSPTADTTLCGLEVRDAAVHVDSRWSRVTCAACKGALTANTSLPAHI